MRRFSRLSSRRKLVVLAAAFAAALGIATAVQASIPDSNGVVHACYNTSLAHGNPTGALRVIDTAKINGHCASWEAPVDLASPAFVQANQFLRLSSDWGQGEFSTDASQQLYEKTVSVPNNLNTLTVTVTGTADDHSGAVQTLTCHIDGNDCSPSADIRIINVGENDWHDNSVVARWCMPVSSSAAPGATDHDLTIDQSSNNEGDVFIEQVLITVDGDTSGTCTDEGFTGGGDAPSHQHR
jgi:FlaG/FlaF family flagellin (archaellin)